MEDGGWRIRGEMGMGMGKVMGCAGYGGPEKFLAKLVDELLRKLH